MDFAAQLREAMDGLTQEQLAALTGNRVRQTTISKYLTGRARPGLEALTALEAALPKLRELRAKAIA